MDFLETLKKRRSHYHLNKDLPLSQDRLLEIIREVSLLSPDAFNAQSPRVVVLFGQQHDELWDLVDESFAGQVPREKIDSFKAGAGTILYFVDRPTITQLEDNFPLYAKNFYYWAHQASGMLQINLWNALIGEGVGASLQHYNPVIDEAVKKRWNLPEEWELLAQMPFGGIEKAPGLSEKMPIKKRVLVIK